MTQQDAPMKESPMVESHKGWSFNDLVLAALLLFSVFLFYSPALRGELIFDDDRHLTPVALQTWHGLWRIWAEPGAAFQYYPVLHTAFWIEHRLWGDSVAAYHMMNLALHAVAALLVVGLMRRLRLPGAWLGAFIFALHPVCVESAAWISEQKNTLSLVFCLGTALAYLRYDKARHWGWYFVATGLFVLAVLTKTVSATLPGALLVIFWWQRGRLEWKRDALPLLPWFVSGGCAGMFSGWMERKFYFAEGFDFFALTFLDRCLLACRALWFYPGKLLWPSNLIFHYPSWRIDHTEPGQYVWVGMTVALAAGLCFLARRMRGPLAAFLIFAGTLFPVLGFFNIDWFCFSYVADHFQYMASLGIIIPAAACMAAGARQIASPAGKKAAICAGVMLVLVLSSLTWKQSQIYRDMETLYSQTLERNPDCYMGHYNYGLVLMKIPGRFTQAMGHFEEALRLHPNDATLYMNVGSVMLPIDKRLPEAVEDLAMAVKLKPGLAEAHYYLGVGLLKMPDGLPDGVTHLEEALRLNPNLADAHYFLGAALSTIPARRVDAIKHLEAALRLQPDMAAAKERLEEMQKADNP